MRLILIIMLLIPLQMFASDLVLHLKFEEASGTLVDQSGYGNNGTVSGATYHASGAPNRGYGMSFDGTNDYAAVSDDASIRLLGARTFEAWVKGIYGVATMHIIVGKYGSSGEDRNYYFGVHQQKARCFIANDIELTDDKISNSVQTFSDNQGYHIAATWDGSAGNGIIIYVNGIADTCIWKNASFTVARGSTEDLNIGARTEGINSFFNGTIDEVKIYNYARTPAQILHSYNQSGYR